MGFEDYPIDSAGLANFPNFTVTNDPMVPKKASPGWNLYLTIPFSQGCRILLSAASAKNGGGMIDWQQYRDMVKLTPLRFHAQRNIALPGKPTEPFPIAETEGAGFLAGYIMGWRQRDRTDMVFHNSGTRLLITPTKCRGRKHLPLRLSKTGGSSALSPTARTWRRSGSRRTNWCGNCRKGTGLKK